MAVVRQTGRQTETGRQTGRQADIPRMEHKMQRSFTAGSKSSFLNMPPSHHPQCVSVCVCALAVLVFVIHRSFEPQAGEVLEHKVVILGDTAAAGDRENMTSRLDDTGGNKEMGEETRVQREELEKKTPLKKNI